MHAFPQDALPPDVVSRRFSPRIPFTYAMITQDDDARSAAVAQFGATLPQRRPRRPSRPPPQPSWALKLRLAAVPVRLRCLPAAGDSLEW